jgi:AraC-like DNA-binding protein
MKLDFLDRISNEQKLINQTTAHENHLIYVASGNCTITIEKKEYPITYRNIVYLRRNVQYHLVTPENESNLVYRFHFIPSTDSIHLDLDSLCMNNELLNGFMNYRNQYNLLTDRDHIYLTINELIQEMERSSPLKDMMVTSLMTILYIKMARSYYTHGNPAGISYVSEVKKYIAEHSSEPLRIQQIADHIGISRSYLEAVFSQYAGRRITTHINTVRVDKAAVLLTVSNQDILEIALEVGYENRQHFTREFQKRYHVSPSQYRRLYGNSQ